MEESISTVAETTTPNPQQDLRLVEAERNKAIRAQQFRPGFFGLTFLLPSAKKALPVSDGRVIYLAQHIKAMLWESVAPGMRYGADRRDSRLVSVMTPKFRSGIPTFDPAGAEVSFDFHPEAKDPAATENARHYRAAAMTEAVALSAARRHNPAWRREVGDGQKVVFGGEEHDRLPNPEEWAPKPLIGMRKLSVKVLWDLLQCPMAQHDYENRLFTRFVATQLRNLAVYAPCHGRYLGVRGGTRNLNRHLFVADDGTETAIMLPRSAVMHRDPKEPVQLGGEVGHALDMATAKAIAAHPEAFEIGDPRRRKGSKRRGWSLYDIYAEVEHRLGFEAMQAVEMLIINQQIDWLAPDRPMLPWDVFQTAITKAPERFYWYAMDFTPSCSAYEEGSNAVTLAFSRPRDRSEIEIEGMRIVLPSTRDALVRSEPRYARSKPKAEKKAKPEPKQIKTDLTMEPVQWETKETGRSTSDKPNVEEVPKPRVDKKAFRRAKAEVKGHVHGINAKHKVVEVAESLVTVSTVRDLPKPEEKLPSSCQTLARARRGDGLDRVGRVEIASVLKPLASPLDDLVVRREHVVVEPDPRDHHETFLKVFEGFAVKPESKVEETKTVETAIIEGHAPPMSLAQQLAKKLAGLAGK